MDRKMDKKIMFFVLSLFLISLFSVMVAADVPTPADALKGLGSFFTGLFTGKANWDNAYLLSFILYFIIFMAIFVEGLKWLPFFGGRGEISTPGKWFAFAAAMLATLGIFVGEQVTGRTGRDAIAYVTAPFGIWGGVALAVIIALIAYKGIKDSGVFGESTLNAMAIAAAIGLTVVGWLLSLENILGWGFLIMIIVMIVGAIRAWMGREKAEVGGEDISGGTGGVSGGGVSGGGEAGGSAGGEGGGGSTSPEKIKGLEKKLARALRRVWRYNRRVYKNLKAAHKESLKKRAEANIKKLKKEIEKVKKFERKEIDFDALANKLVEDIEKIAGANPDLKNKLDILNKTLKKELANMKDKIPKAEKAVDKNWGTVAGFLLSTLDSSQKIVKEILGMEVVAKGLKNELAKRAKGRARQVEEE